MPKTINSTTNQSLWLYRLVFRNRRTRLFVVSFILLFSVQPALIAYAAAEEAESEPVVVVEEETVEPVVEREIVSENEVEPPKTPNEEAVSDKVVVEESSDNPTEIAVEAVPEDTEVAMGTEDMAVTNTSTLNAPAVADTSTSTESVSTVASSTVPTGTETPAPPTTNQNQGQSNGTDTAVPVAVSATSSESTVAEPVTTPIDVSFSADTKYQFGAADCVRVDDGSYYCEQTGTDRPQEDSFYVALDADGDREIFLQLAGESKQLTHNTQDDAAPYYDAAAERLVWHSLLNGRYQIMQYDFATEETKQLTDERVNNMEPTSYDGTVVWQRWNQNNWDIVLFDGKDEQLLSEHTAADIAPAIYDGYVTWKRVYADEQVVVLYDLETEEVLEISDTEAGAWVKNARMMLVYEGETSTGDQFIRGFDPTTQETVAIAQLPTELPERLPNSEPTEEVRALVQSKPTTEEEEVAVVATSSTDREQAAISTVIIPSTNNASTTATSTTTATTEVAVEPLIVPSATTTEPVAVTAATATSSEPVIDEVFDLIIPPTASSTQ